MKAKKKKKPKQTQKPRWSQDRRTCGGELNPNNGSALKSRIPKLKHLLAQVTVNLSLILRLS